MHKPKIISLLVVILICTATACSARKNKDGSFNDITQGLEKKAGFFDIYIDKKKGKVFARLPKPDEDGVSLKMIYANSLNAGLGSNPIGFDRGQTTSGEILAFRIQGGKVVAEIENWRYRATRQPSHQETPQDDNQSRRSRKKAKKDNDEKIDESVFEKQSVRNSFAKSYIWAGKISSRAKNGDLLVDISELLTLDRMNIQSRLKAANQGHFTLSKDRTFPQLEGALAFPDNVEIDAALTFTSDNPGNEVAATAADGRSFTLSLHHSFVRLPDDGFRPRPFDTRTAAIDVGYYDFSAELTDPIYKQYARRFRLERVNRELATGPVKKPIIFYVDRGAPEPIRSALIEGASWWAAAFAQAGFEDAFKVEVLPEDAHPMDIRYNVIQWTHRQTRGWSYGGGIFDPRTGEMLKAHVILGSQRVRQDRMIFEGLAGTSNSGTGRNNDPVEIALSRIRQLSAHEVGHTLGFAHNFAASTLNRASVMDYPAPDIKVDDEGELDFSTAYAIGIGEWDKFTVKWLYTQFAPDTDETKALNNIVDRAYEQGMKFVSDAHSRSTDAAHADASLWDNGADPVAALEEAMDVRRIAMRNFDLSVIKDGNARSQLRAVFVPIYLYHRYQVEAVAKLVGGYRFNYAIAGDDLPFSAPVTPDRQREAIAALLQTLDTSELDISNRILARLSPPVGRFGGNGGGNEAFTSGLREIFDPLAAADSAASITLQTLLQPTRLARLIETNRINAESPSYEELLAALDIAIFAEETNRKRYPIARRIQTRFALTLMALAQNPRTSPDVRAETDSYLYTLQNKLSRGLGDDNLNPNNNHRAWLLSLISAHTNRDDITKPLLSQPAIIPPGSPIGSSALGISPYANQTKSTPARGEFLEDCWHCDDYNKINNYNKASPIK